MDIYISNFSTSFDEGDLKDLFGAFGHISSVNIIKDRYTGESKCFGFISMPNEDEALDAIAHLHNQQIGYRKLEVSKAQPRTNYRLL
jgi:RNA recognition motif-containing protein